jgi:hypothetical protein
LLAKIIIQKLKCNKAECNVDNIQNRDVSAAKKIVAIAAARA